jgi:hypothetical protein
VLEDQTGHVGSRRKQLALLRREKLAVLFEHLHVEPRLRSLSELRVLSVVRP